MDQHRVQAKLSVARRISGGPDGPEPLIGEDLELDAVVHYDGEPVGWKNSTAVVERYDSATILSSQDPMVINIGNARDQEFDEARKTVANLLGGVIYFEEDPTIENLARLIGEELHELSSDVEKVGVELTPSRSNSDTRVVVENVE